MGSRVHEIAFALNGKVGSSFKGSMTNAAKSLGALNNKIVSLEQVRKKSDRFTALKKDIRETKKEFDDARNKSEELAKQLAATGKPTKQLKNQFDAANRQIKKLKKSIDKKQDSLSVLRREMTSAGVDTKKLASHNRALAQSIDLARRKEEKLQKVMMKQKSLQDKRSGMQGKLFDAAAIGAAVAAPTMIAARFEQSMAEVKSLTGATGEDFQALTAKARLLGSTTSFSASEAAQGMKYLGMAGFDTTQIVSAMPGVLNMAKAGAVDLGQASDIASDIMSGFGLKASEMGRVSDVLTRTFTSSNTSLGMLGETMKYVGPVASKAGMSLEEASAMAGLLGNVGIKASMAGTTLRSMVLGLASETPKAEAALSSLGVSTKDTAGNLRGFPDILADIAGATQNMGNADRLDMVSTIFGKESASGITELLSQAGEDGIKAYIKKVRESKGAAASIAKVMDNTTIGSLKGLGSAAEGLAIVFGNTLTPGITMAAHSLAFVTRGITAVAEKFPNATKVIGILTGGTIALTTAAVAGGYAWTFISGGLLQAQKMFQLVNLCMNASTLKTVALSGVQKAAAIGTYAMTAAQWALNIAMNASPIGLVAAGVLALAGLGAILYKKFEPFQKLVDSMWAKVKKLLKIGAKFFGFGGDEETEKAAKVGEVAAEQPPVPIAADQTAQVAAEHPLPANVIPMPGITVPQTVEQTAQVAMAHPLPTNVIQMPGIEMPPATEQAAQVAMNYPLPANVIQMPGIEMPEMTKFPDVRGEAAPADKTISIDYHPQIHITATGSNVAEFKAAADQSLMEGEERLRKTLADIHHDDRRRALA